MKIAVALSGGIDSSAAAWLLKNQGHEVVGITMCHFSDQVMGFDPQNGIQAVINQAERVCRYLDIPHNVIDLKNEFAQTVISNFVNEYALCRTPNPCTLCNRTIKWGSLLKAINDLGIEKMATGHYIKSKAIDGYWHLFRSSDQPKDQSYMLWQLQQHQIRKTIFPLADFSKDEARRIIIDNQIPTPTDQESQEICFIRDHYQDFLKTKLKLKPGDIVLPSDQVIGTHYGLPLYTIGQRKGLHTRMNVPLYVMKLHHEKNELVVTTSINDLEKDVFEINNVNWIAQPPEPEMELSVMVRYNSPAVPVKELRWQGESLQVLLNDSVRAVTPGQSAVFYHRDELMGGGLII